MADPANTTITVTYDVSYKPDPLVVNTTLSIDNDKSEVQATINSIPNLSVTLDPVYSSNPIDDIVTAVGSLINVLSPELSKIVGNKVKGTDITVYTISDIPIDEGGINLTLSPGNLTLENYKENGKQMMLVYGDIKVSGL